MKRLTLLGIPGPIAFLFLLLSKLSAQTLPVVHPVSNAPLCANTVDLQLDETGGAAVSWLWSGPNGFSSVLKNPVILHPGASWSGLYTVKITNAAGQTNTGSIQVHIHNPGSLSCNDNVKLSLDEDGVVPVTPIMVLQGNYPDPEFYTVDITTSTGQSLGNTVTCAQVGQTLTVRVTDICDNNSCWGTLKVEDKLAPKLVCPIIQIPCNITNYSPAYLKNTLGIIGGFPIVTENCPGYTQTFVDEFHDQDCPEMVNILTDLSAFVNRRWTVTDAHGNSTTCQQSIKLKRLHLPDLQMPPNITVSCVNPNTNPAATGTLFTTLNGIVYPMYPDAGFCEMNLIYTDELIPVCDGTHKIIRTWLAYDWCLASSDVPPVNPLVYKQLIVVMDSEGPKMTCPTDLTVGTDPFQCCATVQLPDLTITDNCSRVNNFSATIATLQPDSTYSLAFPLKGNLLDFPNNNLWNPDTLGHLDFTSCLPVNRYLVTYRAEDDCTNASSCTFYLTVADQIPPVAACDTYTTVGLGSNGMAEVNATTFDDGSYDICCLDHVEARRMNGDCNGKPDDFGPTVLFCCTDINDTVPVILRVYDCHGNYNECMVLAFVQDKIKPVCTPPANVTVGCENFDPSLWSYGKAIGTDNCCIKGINSTANYSQFDTVCNLGTIIRTFKVTDCAALTNQCTQRIIVKYKQDYYIKMPNDAILYKCDGTGKFGEPSFFKNGCELLGVSYEDQIFTVVPDACYKIERTWKIINWCTYDPNAPCIDVPNPNPSPNATDPNNIRGPVISPSGTTGFWTPTTSNLTPTSPTTTHFSDYYDPNANCYTYHQIIKVIDSQDPIVHAPTGPVTYCDQTPNAPDLWNEPDWWDNVTSSHNLCEGPTDLTITAIDSCEGTQLPIRYLLFLDLDNNGTMETVVNSDHLPDPGTVLFNSAHDPNFQTGTPRVYDERNVPVNEKYQFAIQTAVVNKLLQASIRWNTKANPGQYVIPELPYGTHKIKWIVEDGCGNETIKEYTFTVKDCKAPTAVCINGLSVNIMPDRTVPIWASDLLQYAQDNCTPSNQIKLGIRKSGTGTGFPLDVDGNPQTGILFSCDELGTNPVELWAMDAAGNADFCETYVLVQDNLHNCPPVFGQVAGLLTTETPNGLEAAQVQVTGGSNAVPTFNYNSTSDHSGNYITTGVPFSPNVTVTPQKNDNPLNGVTTYDLVLISKHILGIQPLGSPYKMIAADANRSGSITTLDLVELRKLILGLYPNLPSNTSWRFVDKKFSFPNPLNPFQSAFPEFKIIPNFQNNTVNEDFIAIKIGDVNGTAISNSLLPTNDRSEGLFELTTDDRPVKAGETVQVNFRTAGPASAIQFTLQYNDLELTDLLPGAFMSAEHFAVFNTEQTLTASWFTTTPGGEIPEFTVIFKATRTGMLSNLLRLSDRITPKAAFNQEGTRLNLDLEFNHPVNTVSDKFELYQNQPNPFAFKTTIGFYLPEGGSTTFTITDPMGREIYQNKAEFSEGSHQLVLDRAALGLQTGTYFYKLETPTHSATRKMVITAMTP
jgi:hypothetical protein